MKDLLIIGGGINGVGIARDAAGRGLSAMLVEKDDLASHTSSASTKLVHGGLRYLEHYEFRLVRESLHEREVLLNLAPHIIWPLRFILPHDAGLRPKWMLRIGLFLYDHIGGRRSLPGSRSVNLRAGHHGKILQDRFTSGFEYSDCWVQDSRLVVLNAVDARERGAEVCTRTRCTALTRERDRWIATMTGCDGIEFEVEARTVVNAAGPWVDDCAEMGLGAAAKPHLRLVKGSHIIVPRWFDGTHSYIFQNSDGRIVFAIPYEHDFTLIGTTDRLFEGDRDNVQISDAETEYLCAAASEYFRTPLTPADVVSSYAGIRPLYEDKSASNSTVTRDYTFDLDDEGGAPILSIYGGKITTYRKLAEHAMQKLSAHLDGTGEWTATTPLPGGDMADFATFLLDAERRYSFLPAPTLLRLARAYGTRIDRVIGHARQLSDLGEPVAGDLYPAEIAYMREQEFAVTAQDMLWRRSKLGLHLPAKAEDAVTEAISASKPQIAS